MARAIELASSAVVATAARPLPARSSRRGQGQDYRLSGTTWTASKALPMASKQARPGTATLKRAVTLLVARAAFALLGLILTACNSIGPGTVPRDRVDYANALSDSWKDQMLLNIVRLRYSDAPTFLDVSSVISAYTMQGGLQASALANVGVPNDTTITPNGAASVSAAGGYNDRPTISYTPLSGSKFAKSLLQPIPPEAIFSLIAAGYPAENVIPTTVNALNGVYNRTSRGGKRRPSDPEFYPLVEAMGRIQASRSFSLRIETQKGQQVAIVTFSSRLEPALQQDIEFVKKTLNLRSKNGEVILDYGALQRSPNELAVVSRSMIEIMQQLSADMEVPAADVSEGRTYATAAPPANASPYDQPRVAIHSGAAPPGDAFTAVRYRATWYWISDHDLSSKGSLTFLLLFFSLAETGVVPEVPVLTLPVQ
jgi:hypothetical protein